MRLLSSYMILVSSNVTFYLLEIPRGGFRSGGSGIGQIRCPSVENKFTDNPSANRPLISSGGRVG